jgi:ribonuclease P protein component
VLPASQRITRSDDLRQVSRRGRRSGSETLVVHLLAAEPADRSTRFGFVVSRAVGNAVVRHRVQRQLRHLARERLRDLPPGTQVVVRALPPAGAATYAELGVALDRCLQRTAREGARVPRDGELT